MGENGRRRDEREVFHPIGDFLEGSELDGARGTSVVQTIMVAGGEVGTCGVVVAGGRLEEEGGGAIEMISHTPSSGSLNLCPIKSDPSAVGKGREAVPGMGWGGVAGSSKWKRGSG